MDSLFGYYKFTWFTNLSNGIEGRTDPFGATILHDSQTADYYIDDQNNLLRSTNLVNNSLLWTTKLHDSQTTY